MIPTALIEAVTSTTITCEATQLELSGLNSLPGGQLSYAWSTNTGNIVGGINAPLVVVDEAGTYQLLVQDQANGCADSVSIQIDIDQESPSLEIADPDFFTCVVTSVQLDVSASVGGGLITASWTGPPGAIIDDSNSLQPTVYTSALYFVTITDESNGCTADGSVLVGENIQFPEAVAASTANLDCQQTEVEITGLGSTEGGTINYAWSTLSGGTIFDPFGLNTEVNAPGWYTLIVTDSENGCTDTASVEVFADALPINDLSLFLLPPTCHDEEDARIIIDSVLGGKPPYFFSLNDGPLEPYTLYNYMAPGTYDLYVEDGNGCTFDTTFTIDTPIPVTVDLGEDQTIQLGETVTIDAVIELGLSQLDTLIWTPDPGEDCQECLTFEVAPTYQVSYDIWVENEFGCVAQDRITIFVEIEKELFMANIFSPNGDGQNDIFYVQAGPEVEEIESFQIFDRFGEMVHEAYQFLPNDPQYGWDGRLRGQFMNAQVLVWQMVVRFSDGERQVLKGDITLLR